VEGARAPRGHEHELRRTNRNGDDHVRVPCLHRRRNRPAIVIRARDLDANEAAGQQGTLHDHARRDRKEDLDPGVRGQRGDSREGSDEHREAQRTHASIVGRTSDDAKSSFEARGASAAGRVPLAG
jgi:hypothetical protein